MNANQPSYEERKLVTNMALVDFVCADFYSAVGTNDYPSRNCTRANARFAEQPSPLNAPCCGDARLVEASMELMAWDRIAPQFLEPEFLSPGPVSLSDLLEIDDMVRAGPPDFNRFGLTSSIAN